MPAIKIDHVVSFSSEDPIYPAENLALPDAYKKWKCKTAGEKQATVILQLSKASVISSIDIGNEHSAFVEVLVGRSGASTEDFQVLVVTSSFMTPLESKTSTSVNRIRIFKQDELTKPTCHEKWDRVKVVCSQPFNRTVQYGLSFIRLNTPEEKEEKLGRFAMIDDEEVIPVGKLFAKRKEIQDTPLTGAAAIRDASTPAGVKRNSYTLPDSLTDKLKAQKLASPGTSAADSRPSDKKRAAPSTSTSETSPAEKKRKPSEKKKPSDNNTHKEERRKDKVRADSKHSETKTLAPTVKKTPATSRVRRKPFNKLLEGVVFVISGYQNPARQTYRDKATAMGAKYRPDWGPGCTHLMCAFVNTPKFLQVKGKGQIVTKQWIEDCYSERKRLPWRRYALDRDDQGKDESDEEVLEEVATPDARDVVVEEVKKVAAKPAVDSGSDTEDEIERFKLKRVQDVDVKKRAENGASDGGKAIVDEDDTDTDDVVEGQDTKTLPLPHLPDFFSDKMFYLHGQLSEETKAELNRYVVAFNGKVTDDLTEAHIDFFLADEDSDSIREVLTEHPDMVAVTPDWVWKCNDNSKLLPVTPYLIV